MPTFVVSNCNGGDIGEDSQEAGKISSNTVQGGRANNSHNQVHTNRLIEDQDRQHQVDLQVDTKGNTKSSAAILVRRYVRNDAKALGVISQERNCERVLSVNRTYR